MLPIKIAMIIGMVITALVSIIIAVVVIRHFFLTEHYEREETKGGSEELQRIGAGVREHIADRNLTIHPFA